MMRLLTSLALAACLAAPALAQDDELPPLPTRAEVLAEIDHRISEISNTERRIEYRVDILTILAQDHSQMPVVSDMLRQTAGDIPALLEEDPRVFAYQVYGLPEMLEIVGEGELADEMLESLVSYYQPFFEQDRSVWDANLNRVRMDLIHIASRTGHTQLFERLFAEWIGRLDHLEPEARMNRLITGITIALNADDISRARAFNAELADHYFGENAVLIREDGAINRSYQSDAVIETAIVTDAALGPDWFFRWHRTAGSSVSETVSSARSLSWDLERAGRRDLAIETLDLALRYLIEADEARHYDSLLAIGSRLAGLNECGLAIGAMALADAWEAKHDFLAAHRQIRRNAVRYKQAAASLIGGPSYLDSRVLTHPPILPSSTPDGRRFDIRMACVSASAAVSGMLADLDDGPHWLADFGLNLEGGQPSAHEARRLREAIGQQLDPERFFDLARNEGMDDDGPLVASLAYASAALREAGRHQEAARLLQRSWAAYNAFDRRTENLVFILMALPEDAH